MAARFNGLITVEFDGTDDLTIRLTDTGSGQSAMETLFRGAAATLSGVPEPSTLAVVSSVLAALWLGRRRR